MVGFVADGSAGVVLGTDEIDSAEIIIGNYSAVIDRDGCRFDAGNISAHITTDAVVSMVANSAASLLSETLQSALTSLKRTLTPSKRCSRPGYRGAGRWRRSINCRDSWAASQLSLTKAADYENTKVKH